MPRKSLGRLARDAASMPVNDLETDQINLLNFLILIVDIRYRTRFGQSSPHMSNENITNRILPDQISSVDDDLEGVSQRRIFDVTR